jgi:hypothetical protein
MNRAIFAQFLLTFEDKLEEAHLHLATSQHAIAP